MVYAKTAPMWAQNVKNSVEKFPPSNKIFFRLRRPRRHRCRNHLRRSPSVVAQKQEDWWCCVKSSFGGGGSERNLNVIRGNSRCRRASFNQNKTAEEHRELLSSPSSSNLSALPWSLSPIAGINPNKLVASIVEGFNRGSVGSAREPLWMEV